MDAKRVNSVGGSSDVDRSFADNKEFPIFENQIYGNGNIGKGRDYPKQSARN